ncbi:MAG TPA: GNAT family N-acetyltransferase [Mycobacteriales bacterium]|jgi:GNAT superfamily N-acetyltransferase
MADVHVRPAVTADAGEIARIQLSTWETGYGEAVPAQVLERFGVEDMAARWSAAIAARPSPAHHVLVAFEQDSPAGFAVVVPSDPDDLATPGGGPPAHDPATTVTLGPLLVEPRWGRRGHGSRLLAAAVDLARADGARTAVTWVLQADTVSRRFLESAGWAGDGTARELDAGDATLREVRLHTDLTAPED